MNCVVVKTKLWDVGRPGSNADPVPVGTIGMICRRTDGGAYILWSTPGRHWGWRADDYWKVWKPRSQPCK